MAAKKPTKEQIAYGKARAGGQGAYKITAKEVKRTAKGVAKAAGLAATFVGPGKFVKAVKVAKAATAAKAAKKAKDAEKTAKVAKNTVKVVPGNKISREAKNAQSKISTESAKSGAKAKLYGSFTSAGNSADKYMLGKKTKVIKIKSK